MRFETCHRWWIVGFALLLAHPASAEVELRGRELRVNRRADFRQVNPAAAISGDGALIVWENDQRGIRGLFYGGNGWPSTPELTLLENDPVVTVPFNGIVHSRREPALAFLPNGDFLLAWTEERAFLSLDVFIEHRDVLDRDVRVQRFGSDGAPLGEPIQLSGAGFQGEPRLIARTGGFQAVWVDSAKGIVGRALDASGTPLAPEVAISSELGQRPAVAANSRGEVLVVWDAADSHQLGVFARLLAASGQPKGEERQINAESAARQARPAVAADGEGFLVAWQGEAPEIFRGFFHLYGRAVHPDGSLGDPEQRLYQGPLGEGQPQLAPTLSSLPAGGFLLTWLTWRVPTGIDLAGLELGSNGKPAGGAFWITERQVQRNFRETAVAVGSDGRILPAWESYQERRHGIAARRLAAH